VVCETCFYTCYNGGYTEAYYASFESLGSAILESDVFVINMDVESDVWTYLANYYPINYSQICYYDSRTPEVYHYEVYSGI
jgi:hypothetical protein